MLQTIRKDYPTTGVLKLIWLVPSWATTYFSDQEGLPDYWGIETNTVDTLALKNGIWNQEGLPDYWGIETCKVFVDCVTFANQEGLPDYWGIETC